MDGGNRRQRRNNYRRSLNKKPHQGSWQRSVPSWEKDFCQEVGSLDWETLLRMKKCMHFYENVLKWDDSAGEEAFFHAKRRYWAQITGLSCDFPPPDPDLYIDKIDWDSKIAPEVWADLDSTPVSSDLGREPVVIFGDSFVANNGFAPTGWGDDDENVKIPVNNYPVNYEGQEWNLGDSCNPMVGGGWHDGWQYQYGYGNEFGNYVSWGDGWNSDSGWGYYGNYGNYMGPYVENNKNWANGYGGQVSSHGPFWACENNHVSGGVNEHHNGAYQGKQVGREWNQVSSWGPTGQRATAVRTGENWNRGKRVAWANE